MSSKIFDIPFRTKSNNSDFICKDGEILEYDNATLNDGLNTDVSLENLPVPETDFALVRTVLPGWHINPDVFPSKTLIASNPSMEYWTKLGAQLLSQFQSEASLQKLFVAPFYVLAVWKTMDGHYVSPSSPLMLVPNSNVPLVATNSDIDSKELDFKIAGAVCSLYFRIKAPETLRDWVGKISSLELLVSGPLQTYDTFHAFLPYKHVTTDSYCESLDLKSGEIAKRRICTETLNLAWKANTSSAGSSTGTGIKYQSFASIPFGDIDLYDSWKPVPLSFTLEENQKISYEEIEKGSSVASVSLPVQIEGKGETVRIITRPIKLSGGGKLKIVDKVHLRGDYDPALLTILIHGSRDMLTWWCISKRKGVSVVSLPRSRFRFFKIEVVGYLAKSHKLQGLTFSCLQ